MLLENRQLATLRAAMDRIIPADDYPGAWDAGTGDYLLRQFERDLASLLPTYRAGLDALDAEAQAQWGSGFAELAPEQQDAVLAGLERNAVLVAWEVVPPEFFGM